MKKIQLGISEALVINDNIANQALNSHPYFSTILAKYFELYTISVNEEADLISTDLHKPKLESSTAKPSINNAISYFCGYIINADIPYPANPTVNLFNQSHALTTSASLPALQFIRKYPLIPVEDAHRLLGDSQIRDNFFERVFVISRWHDLITEGITAKGLFKFHTQHKFIIMSHIDDRDLGKLLAELNKDNVKEIAQQYINQLMITLLGGVNRANHVNVLQHIQGYLKKELSHDEKVELEELKELYRNGVIPLMAPLTLLNHYFHKYPDPYIQEAYYMHPYPYELTLIDKKLSD